MGAVFPAFKRLTGTSVHQSSSNDQVCVNEFIYAEILQGIRDDKQFSGVKTLLDSLPILPYHGMDTVEKAIQIYRTCNKKNSATYKNY